MTLQTLRNRGIKLGVITNGQVTWQQQKLDALRIACWFDVVLISEAGGVRKPDTEIFRRALARCVVDASEAIFPGDHPDADVGGALQAGLRAVWKAVPHWSCNHDVPCIRQLSEVLAMCESTETPPFKLRPATDADLPFMYQTHCLGLGPYIRQIRGWDEEKERAFFFGRFSASDCKVIVAESGPAGFLRVEDNANHLRLDYIVLSPEHQRRGIGSAIVSDLLAGARQRDVPVKLNVLRVNPAKALYERLGFREVGGDEHRVFMEAP